MSKKSLKNGFTPLQFTHFDGRGRKSKEPPPTDSRGLFIEQQPTKLSKTPRSRKKKPTVKSKSEADELMNITKLSDGEAEDNVTPPFALRNNKRKYGYSAAERKEKQRAARLKKQMEYDENRKKQKLAQQNTEEVDDKDAKNDADELDFSIGKKNDTSPQKSDCDFGDRAELFEFKENSIPSHGTRDENVEIDTDDDDGSPIKRRLFTKKRVIEESDEDSGETDRDESCDKRSNIRENVLESDDETSEIGLGTDVELTEIKKLSGALKGKPNKKDRDDLNFNGKLVAAERTKAPTAAWKKLKKQPKFDEACEELISRNTKSSGPRVKPRKTNQMVDAEDVSVRDLDEFDFDADEVEVESSPPVPNGAAAFNVSRRTAKLDAKSALARSPYAQEMFARASALAKKTKQPGKKSVDIKEEKDLALGRQIESKDESVDEAKTTRSTRKSSVKKTKAKHYDIIEVEEERRGNGSTEQSRLTAGTTKKATKAQSSVKAAESDDESEYQPTQEVKKHTRANKKAAGATKKQMDVDPSGEESEDESTEMPQVTARSRRFSAKHSTRADTDEFPDECAGQRNSSRSTAKATSKNAAHASDEKENNGLVKVDQVTRSSKRAAAKNAASKIAQQNAASEDETEYQLTQNDKQAAAFESNGAIGNAIGKKHRGGTKRCHGSSSAQDSVEHDLVLDDADTKTLKKTKSSDNNTTQPDDSNSKDEAKYNVSLPNQDNGANDNQEFVVLSTRPVLAHHRSYMAEIQRQNVGSEPSTPSTGYNSKMPLSAVSLSNEKHRHQSFDTIPVSARHLVETLLARIKDKEEAKKQKDDATQLYEEYEREVIDLASRVRLALAQKPN